MSEQERAFFGLKVSYVRWVFEKFTNEIGILHPGDRAVLTPPQDHEWPRAFQAERKIRSLGSPFKTVNRVLVVDEAMKNLIEGLEPSVHQFRPITFLQPNAEPFPGSYFAMIIGQFRESFIPEPETEGALWNRSSYLDPVKGRTFTRAHLWRERKLIGPDFFSSDALYDAVKRAKLKVPPMFKVWEALVD